MRPMRAATSRGDERVPAGNSCREAPNRNSPATTAFGVSLPGVPARFESPRWRGHAPRKLGKGWPEHNPIARNAPAISPRAAEKTFALLLLLLRFSAHETSPAAPDNGRKAPPRLAKPHRVCALSQAQSRPGVAHVRRLRARREPAAGRRSCAAPAEARRRLQARQRGLGALGRRLTGLSRGKNKPRQAAPWPARRLDLPPFCPRPVAESWRRPCMAAGDGEAVHRLPA